MGWRAVPYRPERAPAEVTQERLEADYETARARRSVRMFAPDPVPRAVIETAIRIAGTAPSVSTVDPRLTASPGTSSRSATRR